MNEYNHDAVSKYVLNNKLKDFPLVECLRERQEDCINDKVNGKDVFAVLPTGFGKCLIFQLYPRVSSLMNGKAGVVSTIMVVCLALVAIMKIGVAATANRY